MALVILHERAKGDTSPWFPYIQQLPAGPATSSLSSSSSASS